MTATSTSSSVFLDIENCNVLVERAKPVTTQHQQLHLLLPSPSVSTAPLHVPYDNNVNHYSKLGLHFESDPVQQHIDIKSNYNPSQGQTQKPSWLTITTLGLLCKFLQVQIILILFFCSTFSTRLYPRHLYRVDDSFHFKLYAAKLDQFNTRQQKPSILQGTTTRFKQH